MGVVLDDSPGERVLLYGADGATLLKLVVDSSGHLQVDTLTSALPSGAATEAKQDTQITALQLIDDLRNALAAVATDKLRTSVIDSALPTDAATQTTLASCLTALQLIDDLRTALATVATDKLRTSVIDSALPSGAASETTLTEVGARLGDEVGPAAGTINKQLADLLTELGSVLDVAARLYGYNGSAWANLLVESAASPNLRVGIARGSNIAHVSQVNADGMGQADMWLHAKAALYGFNGSTWDRLRSDALYHLYVNQYGVPGYERLENLTPNAGNIRLTGTVVPSGKVWVVRSITAFDNTSVLTDIKFRVLDGANAIQVGNTGAAAAGTLYYYNRPQYFKAGWQVDVRFDGVTAGDDLFAQYVYVEYNA